MEITTPLLKDPNYILWSKKRKLTWEDFQGNPDPKFAKKLERFYTHTSSTIDHRILWGIDNEAKKIEIQCIGVKVWCFFNIQLSWVKQLLFSKPSDYLNNVLNHEQGHFDLSEEYARLMETKLKDSLLNKKFRVPGLTKKEKLQNVVAEQDKIDKKFSSQVWNLKNSEDEKYDTETNHGEIKEMQDKWDARFAKLSN